MEHNTWPHMMVLSVSLGVGISSTSPRDLGYFVLFSASWVLRLWAEITLDFFCNYILVFLTPYGSIILKNLGIKYKTVKCTEKDIKCILSVDKITSL